MQMQQQPEESSICCNKSTHIYMWPSPNRKVFPSPQSSEASDGSKPIVEGQINPPRPSAPPLVAATADGEGNQTVPTSIHEDDHEAVIDLTEHQAPSVDDEEDADYVPESLRSFVQQANNRLWQETQGFYSTLLPHSTDSQDAAEETDASVPNPTFSPDASNIYNSPAATVAKSHAYETPTIDLTNVPETISTPPAAAATIISDDDGTKPEPTALFASPPSNVQDDQKQETASQPVLSISHIGELDETQESMQLESFGDTEGQNMLAPEQFDLDSLESDLVQGEKQGDEIDESLPSDEDPPVPSPLTNIVLPSSIAPVDAPLPPPDTLKDEDAALVPVKDHPMPAETGVERHAQASPKIAGQAKVLLPAIVKQAGESWPAAMGPEVSQMESPAATKDVVTEDEVHESSLGAQQKSSTGSAAAPAADTEKAPSMSFWQRVTQPVLPSQAEKDVSVAEVQTSAQASFALPDQVPVGNPFNPPTTLDEEHALFPAKSQPAIAFEPQKHVAGVREQSISPSVTALEDAQLPETKPNSTQNQSESQQIVRNPPAAKINVSGKEAAASFLFAPDDKFDLSNEKMSTPTSSLQHPLAPPTVASRAKEHERGRNSSTALELPYQVNKAALLEKIAALVNDKKLDGIADLRDESDRDGIRVVIELKRDAVAAVVLNNLYKKTSLQSTFSGNFLALMSNGDGATSSLVPQRFTLRQALDCFLDFRFSTIRKKSKFQLSKVESRLHIVEGLLLALAKVDEVIKIVRSSPDPKVAKEKVKQMLGATEEQTESILRLQLGQLTRLNKGKLDEEKSDLLASQSELKNLLDVDNAVYDVMKGEFKELSTKFGVERKSRIMIEDDGELSEMDLIRNSRSVIVVLRSGYIKRMPLGTFESQGRGTKGKRGAFDGGTGEQGDEIAHCFTCNDHDTLLMVTQNGIAHGIRAYQIPIGSRTAKGQAIPSVLPLGAADTITAVLRISEFVEDVYLVLATEHGFIKRTPVSAFGNMTGRGLTIATLEEGDSLKWCQLCTDNGSILLGTKKGMATRFAASEIRPTGRTSRGVQAMKLREGDSIADMNVLGCEKNTKGPMSDARDFVLAVTAQGFGKRIPRSDFRIQHRGGKGVVAIKFKKNTTDQVCALAAARESDEILLITAKGIIVRQQVSQIPAQSRTATGVLVQRLDDGDYITTVSRVPEYEETDNDAT
ncbi:hypothetical protein MPSEU_000085700 [Mayamaea pseudoterrestris]|nr:hypothetical protein MPSEU_000085700 [Mayamaea pseudoterrestris]